MAQAARGAFDLRRPQPGETFGHDAFTLPGEPRRCAIVFACPAAYSC
ncbi:hypothetical protein [Bordetella sp. FB-8]|nr:hypothetical protein [Bordetella sp. FB-8]